MQPNLTVPMTTSKRTPVFTLPVTPAMLDAACASLPGVPCEDVSRALTAAMEASKFFVETWKSGAGGPSQAWVAGGGGRGGSNAR